MLRTSRAYPALQLRPKVSSVETSELQSSPIQVNRYQRLKNPVRQAITTASPSDAPGEKTARSRNRKLFPEGFVSVRYLKLRGETFVYPSLSLRFLAVTQDSGRYGTTPVAFVRTYARHCTLTRASRTASWCARLRPSNSSAVSALRRVRFVVTPFG